jgi:hypothetical protein
MAEDLLHNLRRKLAHMDADRLARHRTPQVRLSEDAAWDPETGALRGSIEVLIETEDGKERLLHREPLDGAATEEAAADRLAQALSRVLMDHSRWPK